MKHENKHVIFVMEQAMAAPDGHYHFLYLLLIKIPSKKQLFIEIVVFLRKKWIKMKENLEIPNNLLASKQASKH
ncbi:MAG: hypothetical protein IJ511_03825 [Bacteroides sp.]|nr:hypothetical protein [Bacteroides sp.]